MIFHHTENDHAFTIPIWAEDALQIIKNPNTPAMVITQGTSPFVIIHSNDNWSEICGYSAEELVGRSFRFMQGPKTDLKISEYLVATALSRKAGQATIVNYRKDGRPFNNYVRIFPLRSKVTNEITNYLAIFEDFGDTYSICII
jgi:PAS domain S-box-containing protein